MAHIQVWLSIEKKVRTALLILNEDIFIPELLFLDLNNAKLKI